MRQLLIFLFATTLFSACNNNKGWSLADSQKGMKKCMDEVEGKLDDKTANKYCSCVLDKVMAKYPSFDVADDKISDEEGKKMAQACAKQLKIGNGNTGDGDEDVMDGKKEKKKGNGLFGGNDDLNDGDDTNEDGGGGWSTSDRQKFMNTCLQNAMNTGADRQTSTAHCECTLKKIEKKYSSYSEADRNMTREEVDAIEQQRLRERDE